MDDLIKLFKENAHLAYEVDSLRAAVVMYQELTHLMATLLDKENVSIPVAEYEVIQQRYKMRMKQIDEMCAANKIILDTLVGMRTGESPFGMRTGKVTEEDVNRILSDIDPEIVKKMGE